MTALEQFSADFSAHRDCYLAASLPHIPLPDNIVDVALCANFLFAYGDVFSAEFDVAALIELSRLARVEVLIHPVCGRDGTNLDDLTGRGCDQLAQAGLKTETFAAVGTWLRNAPTMRITRARRAPDRPVAQ